MKNELNIFFAALMFYSRIPTPKGVGFSTTILNKATRYFPLVGTIVGAFGAIVFYCSMFVFSSTVSIVAAMIVMILLTGAFHEDALSDFCDGFGGGYGKERILAIMKDSSIGTYGAVGLMMLLLSKIFLLSEIDVQQIPYVFIAGHSLSRLNTVGLIISSKYVRTDKSSKSKAIGEQHTAITIVVALFTGLLPLTFFAPSTVLLLLVIQLVILIYYRYYIHKIIGGYTGDVLGALQQFSEVGFYLIFAAQ